MIDRFRGWWAGRSVREQRLLLAMFALMAVVVLWLGIIRPVGDALASARERHAIAVDSLARVEAQIAAIRDLKRSPSPPLGAPLAVIVGNSAGEAGFTAATVTPQGSSRVVVTIPSVRPIAFFAWIKSLSDRGIVVERLGSRANSDPTLTVDVTFAERGA